MIITIDGPIATGKSTIARKLAERLGYIHFDTGAMYRCVTYAIIKNHVNIKTDLNNFLKNFSFDIKLMNGEKHYFVGEEDVTEQIRASAVTSLVSEISALAAVREKLVSLQQQWAIGVDAVFEGRDLGTVVFPNADLKVFLTGRTEVRAKRRFDELRLRFSADTADLTLDQTIDDINKRDIYDSTREISPLRQAHDAYVVDTSDYSVDEIIDRIMNELVKKMKNPGFNHA